MVGYLEKIYAYRTKIEDRRYSSCNGPEPVVEIGIQEMLWTSNKRTRRLLKQLHALGYIEPNSTYDSSWVLIKEQLLIDW